MRQQMGRTEQRGFRLAPIAQSIALLLATGGAVGSVHAAQPFSAAWYADKGAIQSGAAATGLLPNGLPASSLSNPNNQAQLAAAQTQKSIADLSLAAHGIAAQQAAQAAMRQAAMGAAGNVPDGLGAGGLAKDTNALTQSWINAQDPTQTVDANGNVTVNVQQSASKSILSWQSFNIGQHTTLNFDQSGGTQSNGGNNWVVLNRINDPSGKPSQILGSIKAQGSVYVLNRNGIVFGGGSQVNVNSLVASSLNLFSNNLAASNARFMSGGIGDLNATNATTNSILLTSSAAAPIPGDVTIAPGASLTMGKLGLALVAAPNVTNGGTITAPGGQVALVAGIGVSYDYNSSSFNPYLSSTNDNTTTMLRFANYGARIDGSGNDITPVGMLINNGLIYTPRGNITLLGGAIAQNGALVATTSVAQPGSIVITSAYEVGVNAGSRSPADELDTNFYTGSISFGPQAVTAILADANGVTIPSDAASLTPFQQPQGAASFNSSLPAQGLGVIAVVGQTVDVQSGSLLYAPGQTVSLAAVMLKDPRASVPAAPGAGRVLLESGATIDVAGMPDVELAMSSNLLTVRLAGNELADSPLQQGGFLNNMLVTVDMGMSGVNPETGQPWVGTPLANLSGYASLVQRSINQLLVNGGAVYLSGDEVIGAPDSSINLMGGYLHYLGGMVKTTLLTNQFGQTVNIGVANPNDVFTGIAGQYISSHPRWGVTTIYSNPLIDRGTYVNDYVQGGNAGALNINVNGNNGVAGGAVIAGSGAMVLNSTLLAGDVAGSRQIASNQLPSGGSFNFIGVSPIEIANGLSLSASTLPAGFGMSAPLLGAPGSNYVVDVLDSQVLNDADFKNISLTASPINYGAVSQAIVEDAGASLAVQPGGSISLTGNNAVINGMLTARGGAINIATQPGGSTGSTVPGDIVVGAGAVLDVSGFFINDRDIPFDQQVVPLPINAGSIALVAGVGTNANPNSGGTPGIGALDLSGNLTLAAGSLLDLRGGGHVLRNGQLQTDKNGVPLGSGGSLTLQTSGWQAPIKVNAPLPAHGVLTLDGSIDALGFNGGGTLTLGQTAFQIGGDPAARPSYATYFDAGYWGGLGFGTFNLTSMLQAVVPDGATVVLQHRNLLPDLAAIANAPSGAHAGDYATAGFLTGTQRSATNLSVTAGLEQRNNSQPVASGGGNDAAQVGLGAQILGDPGAAISISSYAMTSILGQIKAPGGSISLAVNSSIFSAGLTGPLYLGAHSVLDVSGAVVINPLAAPMQTAAGLVTPLTGNILAGGAINLMNDWSPILVAPGAILNVSGAAGAFDVAQSTPAGITLTRTPVWSNAGQVNIAGADALLFEGTLVGNPGAPQGAGATLSITGDMIASIGAGSNIILVPDTAAAITAAAASRAGATPFNFATYAPAVGSNFYTNVDSTIQAGVLVFGADSLSGSGFSNVVLNDPNGAIGFEGKVSLTLGSSFIANSLWFVAANPGNLMWQMYNPNNLPGGSTKDASSQPASLTVTAPYIALNGPGPGLNGIPNPGSPQATADATLTLNAEHIDLSSFIYFKNIGSADFISSGDIRLLPIPYAAVGTQLYGYLFSAGNLIFEAADIYPATDTAFIIEAASVGSGHPTPTVTFDYPAGVAPSSTTPLSAGGTLLVDAATIIQNGEIQAPFGSIILGLNTTSATANSAMATALGLGAVNYFQQAVSTQSATLGSGSVTSVSANGAVIPFGSTVDQASWIYNPQINNPSWNAGVQQPALAIPLTGAPQGVVALTGNAVNVNTGAVVNLSGGGDLQASEWIAGTGGSRNVLAQYNTSYQNSTKGQQIPLYPDARQIFAILPGYAGKVAPYDATLSQPGLATGESVYLAGGPGLAAGYYTLLPAKYATLPGAYRVVVNPVSGQTPLSNQTVVLPDGSMEVTGYLSNTFTGSSPSTPAQFLVQSAATWGRYSQYAISSANSFFPAYAATNNLATPYVPIDAGRLVLGATTGLTLNGSLLGAPAPGGVGAQVDISSQFIQIVDSTGTGGPTTATVNGNPYILVGADSLDALGAASLLIGGTRASTSAGMVITPTANGVIIANDAADPLFAPEIMLVAAPQLQSTTVRLDNENNTATVLTPKAGTGQVVFTSGSVVKAAGSVASGGPAKIILGSTLANLPALPASLLVSQIQSWYSPTVAAQIASYYTALDAALGTLVRVSNGSPVTVQIPGQALLKPGSISVTDDVNPANPVFTLVLPSLSGAAGGTGAVIQSGAQVAGGNVLTLASTGDTSVQSGALLSGKNFYAFSTGITFAGSGAAAGGLVIDAGMMAALAQSETVNLQSSGTIAFQGDVSVQMPGADGQGSLTLGAASFSSNGGNVTISAPTLVLDNEMNAAAPSFTAGTGSLAVNAGELIFGAGGKTLNGFGSVSLAASQAVVGQGAGSFNFGSLPVALQTPIVIADTASSQSLTTTGALSVLTSAGTAMASGALGGAIALQGGSVTVSAPIQALAGNISLQASAGDVIVTGTSALIAHGIAKQFVDVMEYAPAGNIILSANQGTVNVASGAVVDFAGAPGGGNGGSLSVISSNSLNPVQLNGTLLGTAAPGYQGSSFVLNTSGAVALDSLAQVLNGAGVSGSIGVQSAQGDLSLSQSLKASTVQLIADAGLVTVSGTIDASGPAGGTIALYGTSGVAVSGNLIARGTDPNQLGGTVEIGTSGTFNPATGSYNATYGYENISAANSGTITIASNAVIDVSGGSFGGKSGGTVLLRAPLLANGGVNVSEASGAQIKGSRSTALEAYAIWSSADATSGAQHFDGIIDPAGWYDNRGALYPGTFVNASGAIVATWSGTALTHLDGTANALSYYLSNDYFLLPGTFSNASGVPVATWSGTTLTNLDGTANALSYYAVNDYFMQTGGNPAHQTFYGYLNGNSTAAVPGTLMGFVENFQPVAGLANFQQTPGIELDNPASAGVNSGNIQVLTNWNLGARNGSALVYRNLVNGSAPYITLRAGGSIMIDASISDGFAETTSLVAPPPPPTGPFAFLSYSTVNGIYSADAKYWGLSGVPSAYQSDTYANASSTYLNYKSFMPTDASAISTGDLVLDANAALAPPASYSVLGLSSASTLDGYYGAYGNYLNEYLNNYYYNNLSGNNGFFGSSGAAAPSSVTSALAAATAAYSPTNLDAYSRVYLTAYTNYSTTYQNWSYQQNLVGTLPASLLPPPVIAGPVPAAIGLQTGGLAFAAPAALQSPASYGTIGVASASTLNGYYGAYKNYYLQAYASFYTNALTLNNGYFSSAGALAPANVTADLAAANAAYSATDMNAYKTYVAAYQTYVQDYNTWAASVADVGTLPVAPLPPPNISLPTPPTPAPVAVNTPAPMATPLNIAPIAAMSLAADASSSSYRFVAGARQNSADPLAVSTGGAGDVTIDQNTAFPILWNNSSAVIVVPTIVRTGAGSIDIAAAGNFALLDPIAPGVVYTAGKPVQPAIGGDTPSVALGLGTYNYGNTESGISTLLTPETNTSGGGNISINVGGDIIGIQNVTDTLATNASTPSGLTSSGGTFVGQFWEPWLLTNPSNPSVPWYVNFGSFDQGVMSIGGNVNVSAGGNIRDLAVSLPTTAYLDASNTLHVTGGGNLAVTAGGNIYSGDFYVGQGAGTIKSGGAIAPDFSYKSFPVATLLAVQYGTISVGARQSADIGGVFDPTYLDFYQYVPNSSVVPSVASYNPAILAPVNLVPYVTSMGTTSGVSVQATSGSVSFNSLMAQGIFSFGDTFGDQGTYSNPNAFVSSLLLPASLNLVALQGGITVDHGGGLYPSATGTLSIIADQSVTLAVPLQSINLYSQTFTTSVTFAPQGNVSGFALEKLLYPVGTGILPTASNPTLVDASQVPPAQTIDPALVQGIQAAPVRVYSLTGSIIDGVQVTAAQGSVYSLENLGLGQVVTNVAVGGTTDQISLIANAPAQIYAGQDILNLPFYGQNYTASDTTSIIAGRDIRYNPSGDTQAPTIELAGPGALYVQAGRNISFPSQRVGASSIYKPETGIRTLGNSVDTGADPIYGAIYDNIVPAYGHNYLADYGNPYLPIGGASVSVLFGVGPGIDTAAFINQYVNPANAAIAASASQAALIGFVSQYEAAAGDAANAPQTADQAWTIFQTLPAAQQKLLAEQVLNIILDTTGKDYNNPASPFYRQYSRGYQAIDTLFPARLGYTANGTGSSNGANQPVATGNFDMRNSTVQTQQGGNISIFGPGGRILVGSSVASPAANPASEGILTLENGSINTFTDGDVLVAQSRVMTEQGGNVLMWSSNGNLDAGKGAKTSVSLPPPLYACDLDFVCSADIKGFVSGAGIATLQSLPGVPVGDANLIAPRGTVDAGAAGIRVSGNINIAALQVANAANIDVQGKATGIPGVAQVNVGALANAGAAATQAVMAAQDVVQRERTAARQALPSIFTVRVLGFGNEAAAGESTTSPPQKTSGPQTSNGLPYNAASPLQFVGMGQDFDPKQVARMNDDERRGLQQGR